MTKHPTVETLEIRRLFADLTLDSTFGNFGRVTSDLLGSDDIANAVAIQADGKIVVAGESVRTFLGNPTPSFSIARYNTDGKLDNGSIDDLTPGDSFGTGGFTTLLHSAVAQSIQAVVIQQDGKIIVGGVGFGAGGTDYWLIARLHPNGTIDRTYGDRGYVTAFPAPSAKLRGLTLQADGKLIAVGTFQQTAAIARFDATGMPDNTFDGDGRKTIDLGGDYDTAVAVAIDNVNNIVIAAQGVGNLAARRAIAIRLGPDGAPDQNFGNAGIATHNFYGVYSTTVNGLVLLPNGRIQLVGSIDSTITTTRYPIMSTLWTFNLDGSPGVGSASGNRYYAAGAGNAAGQSAFVGYAKATSGSTTVEKSFTATTDIGSVETLVGTFSHSNAVAYQPDGNIVAAGYAIINGKKDFVLLRYLGTNPANYGSIAGKTYVDLNGNAAPDANERPKGNVRVYVDMDNDNVFDYYEPSVLTDSRGNFQINGLKPGFHYVRQVTPSGYTRTQPLAGYYRGRVLANHVSRGFNFGNQLTSGGVPKGLSASLTGGVLSIQGTGNDDVVGISAKKGVYNVSVNGETQSFPISTVTKMIITTFGGNDYVQLPITGAAAANIDTGDGNDTVYASSGDDTINGGNGADFILAYAGNDRIAGGAGNDNLSGGDGKDRISAQDGDDTVSGDAGRDILSGGAGNDVLVGGTSNDALYGNDGDDVLNGLGGNDYLDGGNGNDTAKNDASDLTRIAVEVLV